MSRHIKFSSIGIDLTDEVRNGKTYKTNLRTIDKIAIHCSDSPQGRGDDVFEIDRWHDEKWTKPNRPSGIGYHYVILEDGTIQKGRWVDYPGAHVSGHNATTIGICRIGGMGSDGKPLRDVTDEQLGSLRVLTQLLIKLYDLEETDILGHNEFPGVSKDCPVMNMNFLRSRK